MDIEAIEQRDGNFAPAGIPRCWRVATGILRSGGGVRSGVGPSDPVPRVLHRWLDNTAHAVRKDEVASGACCSEVGTTTVVEADAVGIQERCGVSARCACPIPREVESDVDAIRAGTTGIGLTLGRRDADENKSSKKPETDT